MYGAAEVQAEKGRYDDAIRLVRHSILALEPTERNDKLRHLLVIRMVEFQVQAAKAYDEPEFARDAAKTLLAYGERHEQLFGDKKKKQRDAVYELLYDVETLAESLESPAATAGSDDTVVASAPRTQPVDDHAGEDLESEMTRNVRVDKGWFYEKDDPIVRQRLESSLSSAFGYSYLTSPGFVYFPPRALVRQVGFAKPAEGKSSEARRLGRKALVAVRPKLRECFERAVAREGVLDTRAIVEFTVDNSGKVERSTVVSGDVVDGLGDACVIEQFDSVTLEQGPAKRQRVRVSMLFFYDGGSVKRLGGGIIDRGSIAGKAVYYPEIDDFSEPNSLEINPEGLPGWFDDPDLMR